ncbi:MAG: hypothetical protein DLM72_12010 [Candidatus Nitrosopolaris wilkensis]|nr:MAG: hypothetical protein DLM72_12010 [Candidatus Nitrosopolaris wilkensis]
MHQPRIQQGPFNPSPLTVAIGTTVTGTNNDFAPHTVTEVTNKFDSGILAPAHKFKQTFDELGIVKYYCISQLISGQAIISNHRMN